MEKQKITIKELIKKYPQILEKGYFYGWESQLAGHSITYISLDIFIDD